MQNETHPAAGVPASSPVVEVTRHIAAPAEAIFRLLTNPQRHVDLDGSGIVRHSVTMKVVTGVGDVFVMTMQYPQLGNYEMNNRVVEYEHNRQIGWEPEAGNGHSNIGTSAARLGQRWERFQERPQRSLRVASTPLTIVGLVDPFVHHDRSRTNRVTEMGIDVIDNHSHHRRSVTEGLRRREPEVR